MRRTILALALLLSSSSRGADAFSAFCSGFAALSDSAPPEALILQTYGDLVAELGGRGLSPEVRRAWAESNKPFTVPQNEARDLDVLQHKLKQFEKMLRGKGWVTPEVTQRLLARLVSEANDADVAVKKIEQVATLNDTGWEVHAEEATEMPVSFHPSSRWMLMPVHTNPREKTPPHTVGTLFDTQARKENRYQTNDADLRAGTFVQQGDAVLFGGAFHTARLVPFKNGVLDFKSAKVIGDPAGSKGQANQLEKVQLTKDPNVVLAAGPTKRLFRFDLAKGDRIEVDVPKFFEAEGMPFMQILDWGVVPGTDKIFILGMKEKAQLFEATVGSSGQLTKVDGAPVWDRTQLSPNERLGNVTYTPDGKTALISTGIDLNYVDTTTRQPTKLGYPVLQPSMGTIGSIVSIAVSPDGKEAIVVVNDRGSNNRVDVIDLVTKRHAKTLEVKGAKGLGFLRAAFSPDGETLVFTGDFGRQNLSVNYELFRARQ